MIRTGAAAAVAGTAGADGRGPEVPVTMEYPKIETLFDRDEQTRFIIPGKLRLPEFDMVSRWLVTEKIDGTNIRVHLHRDGSVTYGGRTEVAQLYAPLVTWLRARLPDEAVRAVFAPGSEAVLFGEGYGPKIQKGGSYRADVAFRLFDVVVMCDVGALWLRWPDVEDVAQKLHIETVPVLAKDATIDQALAFVRRYSMVATLDGGEGCVHEGVVARTEPLLLTRTGARLMWKLKCRDYPKGQP